MAYTIAHVKSDIEGALHGTTTNQVTNLYGIFNRAARDVLADIDPAETKRIVPIVNALYGNVFDYMAPVDLKGDRVIDIFPQPQGLRQFNGIVGQTYNQQFDLARNSVWSANVGTQGGSNLFTTIWNTGVKSLRISVPTLASVLINNCDSLTSNGTWVAGGAATDLTTDTLDYIQGIASLKFGVEEAGFELEEGGLLLLEGGGALDLEESSSSSAYLENEDMTAVDISTMEPDGSLFAYVEIPSGASVTSFNLRWGSSSSDYWDVSVTANQEGTDFQTGWNLLRFNWQLATTTGTPDSSAVNYLRFTVETDDELITPMHLDDIFAQEGIAYNIEYYSKYMFRSQAGAFKETVTVDSDLINLDVDSYQIFFNKVMILVSQQVQGVDALVHDGGFFQQEYDKSVTRYKNKYKSEVQKPQSNYYLPNTPGYSQYYGSRWWPR